MSGDLSREHWAVPVHGMTGTDPGGVVKVVAHRDGAVSLDLICGDSRATVRFDVCRAAQLSTGIWEAAGAAQQLTGYLGEDRLPSLPLSPIPEDLPAAWRAHPPRNASPRRGSSRSRRKKLTPADNSAVRDATRTIGLLLRRTRKDRDKSLEVISGLAGMSTSTLHHVEHGRRELTLSEIVALANALHIDPWKLIKLPILTPPNGHTNTTGGTAQTPTPSSQ